MFPAWTRTLVCFLMAKKYDASPALALHEAGCYFLALGLRKAGKPPSPH